MYLEGIKDGTRFRRALQYASEKKTVVLLKGGTTPAGTRAVMGHTASLAGNRSIWEALCRQLGVLQVQNLDELIDVLVTLMLLPVPDGRRALLFGAGGGSSVIIADEFERKGITLPQLPREVITELRSFSQAAGNFFNNPIDYSQSMEPSNVNRTLDILTSWGQFDFIVSFFVPTQTTRARDCRGLFFSHDGIRKPTAIVMLTSVVPEEVGVIFEAIKEYVANGYPLYFSFAGAANAINQVLTYYEMQANRQRIHPTTSPALQSRMAEDAPPIAKNPCFLS